MRPPCYNRPPRAEGSWHATGRRRESDGKSIVRWRRSPFEDRCATWDGQGIGPHGECYPVAMGWDCVGCRWAPAHIQARAAGTDWGQRLAADAVRDALVYFSTPSGRNESIFERMARGAVDGQPGFIKIDLVTDWREDEVALPDPRLERIRRISDRLVRDAKAVDNPAHNPRVIPSFEPGLPPGESLPTEGTHR